MVQSVTFSVVEKHGRQICFLTFLRKLVETRSNFDVFCGTVLKFSFKRDIDKSCQWHRTAPSAMLYGTELFFKTLLSEYSQHNLKKAEIILYIHFSILFRVRERREISICFFFYWECGCLFKRMKHLSTIYAFSSYSCFLSKFFGKRNESYRDCNVRYRKVDLSNGKFDIGTGPEL